MEAIDGIFEDGYVEPKDDEKKAVIEKLQSGDFSLSFSSLSAFAISPAAFIAYKVQERKNTPAMLLGEVVHCLVLEPDKFSERFFTAPDVNAATSEGKNAWAKLYMDFTGIELEQNKLGNYKIPKQSEIIADVKDKTGTTILPFSVVEAGKFRAYKLTTNRACRSVLNRITHTEKRVNFEFCGINFKGMIDGKGSGLIADLKNMPDATLEKASGSIWSRRLHWQMFGYNHSSGGGNTCYILAVDGQGETSVHAFSENHLLAAERQMKKYCTEFKRCITESLFDETVWAQSQDFWLRSELNQDGINYL